MNCTLLDNHRCWSVIVCLLITSIACSTIQRFSEKSIDVDDLEAILLIDGDLPVNHQASTIWADLNKHQFPEIVNLPQPLLFHGRDIVNDSFVGYSVILMYQDDQEAYNTLQQSQEFILNKGYDEYFQQDIGVSSFEVVKSYLLYGVEYHTIEFVECNYLVIIQAMTSSASDYAKRLDKRIQENLCQ